MKKLLYLLAVLSVSVFMISCSDSETEGGNTPPPPPATGIDLASLDSLVGDYTVDNYSITVGTAQTGGADIRSIAVEKDNYTLVQGFMSDAAITKSGNKLKVIALISNDSIISKVATTTLAADKLKEFPAFYNIFVNIEAEPTLANEKLGDVATIGYEIKKLSDKKIKVTYKAENVVGTITHSETGTITLTKTSNAATTVPVAKKSLYTIYSINDIKNPFGPLGRYAITEYEYTKAGQAPISASVLAGKEKTLIGGLSVDVNIMTVKIAISISMQTDKVGGFGIDANGDGDNTNDNYFLKKLENIELYVPNVQDPNLVKVALEKLGATINDEQTMILKLLPPDPSNKYLLAHGLPLEAGESIILTLKMLNDGGSADTGTVIQFDDKKFFPTAP